MRTKLTTWKSLVAVAVLGVAGAVSTTPFPARAYVFIHEFERTSRGGTQVSIWERVMYSLIEASDQRGGCRAPKTS